MQLAAENEEIADTPTPPSTSPLMISTPTTSTPTTDDVGAQSRPISPSELSSGGSSQLPSEKSNRKRRHTIVDQLTLLRADRNKFQTDLLSIIGDYHSEKKRSNDLLETTNKIFAALVNNTTYTEDTQTSNEK